MRWLALILAVLASPAAAVTCADVNYLGNSFTTCTVDAETENLRMFHADANGQLLGSFRAIEQTLDVETLAFAMNGGMYHDDRSPVGYYLENGVETQRIIPNAGPGNFGLLPNGVLCITDTSAQVYETLAFIDAKPACRDASQSGPMLVIDGELHPRFLVNATSRFIRNGVGTSADGKTAVFAISNTPVTFHEFGSFFRNALVLPNALYFDGKVSRLYAPQLGRNDVGFLLGPIVGVIE